MNDNELFSIKNEVAVNPKLQRRSDPTEISDESAAAASDASCSGDDEPPVMLGKINFSIAAEPFNNHSSEQFRQLLSQRGSATSSGRIWCCAVAAGFLGGIFAVVGCLLGNGTEATISQFLLTVVVGPFMEEVLKESGTIYLLEKRPWLLRYKAQFFITAALAGLTFAAVENLFYQHIYLSHLPINELMDTMNFRWHYCTIFHMFFAQFSALGLYKAWQNMVKNGRPFEMKDTYYYFIAAATIHGIYNFTVTIQSFIK